VDVTVTLRKNANGKCVTIAQATTSVQAQAVANSDLDQAHATNAQAQDHASNVQDQAQANNAKVQECANSAQAQETVNNAQACSSAQDLANNAQAHAHNAQDLANNAQAQACSSAQDLAIVSNSKTAAASVPTETGPDLATVRETLDLTETLQLPQDVRGTTQEKRTLR